MMKKLMLFAATALSSLVFVGCASVEVTAPSDLNGQAISTAGTPIAHINAQNCGFYFLKWPIAAGSASNPGLTAWFSEDSVNVPRTVSLVTSKAKALRATKVDAISSQRGSMMIPFPFPFLFYWKSTNVSGNAIR